MPRVGGNSTLKMKLDRIVKSQDTLKSSKNVELVESSLEIKKVSSKMCLK